MGIPGPKPSNPFRQRKAHRGQSQSQPPSPGSVGSTRPACPFGPGSAGAAGGGGQVGRGLCLWQDFVFRNDVTLALRATLTISGSQQTVVE